MPSAQLPQHPGGEFGSREVTQEYLEGDEGRTYTAGGRAYYDPDTTRHVAGGYWVLPPDGPPADELPWEKVAEREARLYADREEKKERFQ